MSDRNDHHEFLSLSAQEYPSDDELGRNPVRPALDTLFSEFARRHRSLSPATQSSPRSVRAQLRHTPRTPTKPSTIDLRNLNYAFEYDSHLMCPICHVPFIDPVVLDCDHTFCYSCWNEYRNGAANERPQCPSCRTPVLTNPQKASRLIYNMCNDIKVRCPNEDCTTRMARGYIERHTTRDCLEQLLACPDVKCDKKTKRRNFVPSQCVHTSTVECDCGATIDLGRGEWLRHKDEQCPNTTFRCESCGEKVDNKHHVCPSPQQWGKCLGAEFGCNAEVSGDTLEQHNSICAFARLAPHLKSQAYLLQTMQDQISSSKIRNDILETELERVTSLLAGQIQPKLDQLALASHLSDTHQDEHAHDHENDIEEIPRDNIPSAAAIHHRDLLLPAHIRDLTPSPDLFSSTNGQSQTHLHVHNQNHMQTHLLSLHESLRHTVSNLEADINSLHHALAELDARTNMHIMNETLRIKEDLAYTHAAIVSQRSQVQWLLNRERIGRERAILRERGRLDSQGQQIPNQNISELDRQGSNLASPGVGAQQSQPDTFPFPSPGTGMSRSFSGSGGGSGPSSAATSPMFTGAGIASNTGSTRRPSIRGGSQERVKL